MGGGMHGAGGEAGEAPGPSRVALRPHERSEDFIGIRGARTFSNWAPAHILKVSLL